MFQTVGSYTLNRILTFQILGGESRKTGVSLKKKKVNPRYPRDKDRIWARGKGGEKEITQQIQNNQNAVWP